MSHSHDRRRRQPAGLLLLGGTSEIGLATAEKFASDRPLRVVLAGRPSPRLDEAKARLEGRGAPSRPLPFDAGVAEHTEAVPKAFASGDIDVALVAFGLLGDNEKAWNDIARRRRARAGQLRRGRRRRGGVGRADERAGPRLVVAFSSVAGERARRSNFVYGSTKAGLDAFYTGLTEALRGEGITSPSSAPGSCTRR